MNSNAAVFERKLAEGREIIRKALSELDVQLMAERDTKQYRDKGLRSTSIKTRLGTIEYERHICRDNQSGHYVYLLDDVPESAKFISPKYTIISHEIYVFCFFFS